MRKVVLLLAIWLGFGLAKPAVAAALPDIQLAEVPGNDGLFLGLRVTVWENQNQLADPAAVIAGQFDAGFSPSPKKFPGPAYIKGELWLRLVVQNPDSVARLLVLESRYALTDFISLYQKDPNGELRADHQGDRNIERPDPYAYRSPAFPIMAYPGRNVYYLRTQSQGPNILSLFLWHEAGFRGHRFVDTLILGGLFGFILALLIYNSFLALILRSRTYIYYSIFLFFMILLQTSMQNVWPYLVNPRWSSWLNNEGYLLIGTFTNFSAIRVTIAFLSVKKNLPKFVRVFQGLLIFSVMPLLAGFFVSFDTQARLVSVSVGLGSLGMIVASVVAILRGYRPAAYYFLASLTFLVANFLLTFNLLGIYHAPHVIQYGNFVGVVVQGLLMSLAIGDRVQFIRAKADRVIRALNQELQNHLAQVEAQVTERTETIRTILDNVASGFVIVNPEGRILEGFSQSCHQLLGQALEEGQSFIELLQLNGSTQNIWRLAWRQIFDEHMPVSVSLAQLPSFVKLQRRTLQLECKPLLDTDGRIKNLLFTILDVTELKRKQRESRRHRVLIRILQDLEAFRQFINHSHEFVARLKVCSDKREQAFLLHTLKGNSMVFGLTSLARRLHQLEDSPQLTTVDIIAIESLFRNFLLAHESILKTPWGQVAQQETKVSVAQLHRLEELIAPHHDPILKGHVSSWIQDVLAKPIHSLVHPIIDNGRILAQRLNRDVQIEVLGTDVKVRTQQEEKALEFLVHVLGNAIVHGMAEDRALLGKPRMGKIQIEFTETTHSFRITCRDDGRGFDRQQWEEKARALGTKNQAAIPQMSWVELVAMVSRGGHSTQNEVSLEAGRGVGLEGIIQAVRELGGHIELETESGRGSSIQIEIRRQTAYRAA